MKKTIAIISNMSLCFSLSMFAQDSIVGNKNTPKGGMKKNEIGIGLCYGYPPQSKVGLGGKFNFGYYITPKLGFKASLLFCTNRPADFTDASMDYKCVFDNRNFYNITVGANYYLLGNHSDSKAAIYLGIGIGYQYNPYSYTTIFYASTIPPSIVLTDHVKGVSKGVIGNSTLGGSYKAGPGRVFFEFYLSTLVLGQSDVFTIKDDFGNSSTFTNGPPVDLNTDIKRFFKAMNFGYAICF